MKERFAKFLIIHDKYGFVQAKIPENSMDLTKIASDLRNEDVLKVVGIVKSRGKDTNPKMKTGEIEVSFFPYFLMLLFMNFYFRLKLRI